MCLTVEISKANKTHSEVFNAMYETAEEDITVYKIYLKEKDSDRYQSIFRTENFYNLGELPTVGITHAYSWDYKDNDCYLVSCGYHSLAKVNDDFNSQIHYLVRKAIGLGIYKSTSSTVLTKCIIPKGSTIVRGVFHYNQLSMESIVSNNLIIVEEVEYVFDSTKGEISF